VAAVLVLGAAVVTGEAGVALGGPPLAAPERRPAPSQSGPTTVVVEPGDTLWSLVERAHPGDDPRPLVDALHQARGRAPLAVGETVVIPG
jgi:hypothetical protein